MYLINRDFPLKPGPKCLKVHDMRILTAQKQPSVSDVLNVVDDAPSAVFVVQKQLESLVSSIMAHNRNLLAPDHLRILIAGREKTKVHKNAPIFWMGKSGEIDGFISIIPLNNVATWMLNSRETVAWKAHYDRVNWEMTALFWPRTTSPIINLKAEFFRSRVFEWLQQSEQDVVGGCLRILKWLGYWEKEVSDPLMMPAIWRIIHSVYLSRK